MKKVMVGAFIRCASCRKPNEADARYCISCGTVLMPVYCSSCGTVNPEGLEQCLECGNPLPKLAGIQWKPIVTVLQPTSAMSNEIQLPLESTIETEDVEVSSGGFLSRFRKKLNL